MTQPTSESQFRKQMLRGIFIALGLWGLYLAIGGGWGSYISGSGEMARGNKPALKALIIFSCSAVFLLFWTFMLWQRGIRLRRKAALKSPPPKPEDLS